MPDATTSQFALGIFEPDEIFADGGGEGSFGSGFEGLSPGLDYQYSFGQSTGDFTTYAANGDIEMIQFGGFTQRGATSYSGADGYQNNPAFQNLANFGVIPSGLWQTSPYPGANVRHYGTFVSRLTPIAINNPNGRSGFLIHWDGAIVGTASQGCIILATDYRRLIFNNPGVLYVH